MPSAAQRHMVCRGGPQRGGFGQRGNPYGGRGGYGGRGQRGGGGGGGNILLSPQVIGIFTNLFLQLPFSRRAEAEADLIGLKLMGLAGYDPQVLPQLLVSRSLEMLVYQLQDVPFIILCGC